MSSRQVRLIGAEAQARLNAAQASVQSTGLAAIVEERYLRGAGIQTSSTEAEKLGSSEAFGELDPAAREVAVGALRALETVRRLLAR